MPLRILGIAGSLRERSFNRAVLRAAVALAPDDTEIGIFDLAGIPLFDQDHESTPPARVVELKHQVRAADAVLFVTPEYNYSIPGVLKNAIDWGSRPYGDNVWQGKPAAVMGATVGVLGTSRAQYHLRQILVALDMPTLHRPEVMISQAPERFDERGELVDPKARELVRRLLVELAAWTRRLTPGPRSGS
jgi:chromate reductase